MMNDYPTLFMWEEHDDDDEEEGEHERITKIDKQFAGQKCLFM